MLRPRFGWFLVGLVSLTAVLPQSASAFTPNSLILNEANAVSGTKYLDGTIDSAFGPGAVQGNGQNWLEFLVVQGDETGGGYKNTLDLRGWTMDWSFDKDNLHVVAGSGTIQFSQDPLWAAVPRGTMITISEWSDVWYRTGTLARTGGSNGLGVNPGSPKGSNDIYIGATSTTDPDPHILATNTNWNPGASGGGENGDWNIHVFAGDTPLGPQGEFKYFKFTGNTPDGAIGTIGGGLFVANNDNWQYTIKDQQLNVIQGPYGESLSDGGWAVNSMEMIKLEGDGGRFAGNKPPSEYLTIGIHDLNDGDESTFGKPNAWDNTLSHQGLGGLRNWLQLGDADLDGAVTSTDYLIWRKHLNSAGGWRDGDFSGNGTVDLADFNIWRANFGQPASGSGAGLAEATVPEPHTSALLAMGMMTIAIRRARSLMRGR